MARGQPRTESGRLNAREARELAKEVAASTGLSCRLFTVAQGLAIVEVRQRDSPYSLITKLRSHEDWEQWRPEGARLAGEKETVL